MHDFVAVLESGKKISKYVANGGIIKIESYAIHGRNSTRAPLVAQNIE